MNFLAHLLLSGEDPELLVGNFIADHVKGNAKYLYPERIRLGIELHRKIDHFTDTHPITAESKALIYPTQKKYAPVVVDLYYDHFLAANFNQFSSKQLPDFASFCYTILSNHYDMLPVEVQSFLPFMIERNWLNNYATVDGIGRSLKGLSRRVNFENQMHLADEDLLRHYQELEHHFHSFFPELIYFVESIHHETLPQNKA